MPCGEENMTDCEHKIVCCKYTGFSSCNKCDQWHSQIIYGKAPKELMQYIDVRLK